MKKVSFYWNISLNLTGKGAQKQQQLLSYFFLSGYLAGKTQIQACNESLLTQQH